MYHLLSVLLAYPTYPSVGLFIYLKRRDRAIPNDGVCRGKCEPMGHAAGVREYHLELGGILERIEYRVAHTWGYVPMDNGMRDMIRVSLGRLVEYLG